MLKRLEVKNYILIRELQLTFPSGFTSITGETGAGKSILIGAIGLILGNRADSKAIREGEKKAIIEAEFDIHGIADLEALFEETELDYDPSACILRREILASGKSRAFVNDTPVTLAILKAIGEQLVDIHSQHHNMLIGNLAYQMRVIDVLAKNEALRKAYQKAFSAYQESDKKLHSEEQRLQAARQEADYITFQLQQLEEAELKPNELAELEERQAIAKHAEEITEVLSFLGTLYHREAAGLPSLSEQLSSASRQLTRVAEHYHPAEGLIEQIEALRIELDDLTHEAGSLLDSMDSNSGELEQIEARIDIIQELLYKHHLTDSNELITLRDKYAQQVSEVNNSDHYLQELQQARGEALQKAETLAQQVTKSRQKVAKTLTPKLQKIVEELGVAGVSFQVAFTPLPRLTESGQDQIQFLFATNKQSHLQPIAEVASGGEISRFMLALKSIMAQHMTLPTIIFDEIDTGVSGMIAEKLGSVMQHLGTRLQVLSITHLPQIAAMAKSQLVVQKIETPREEGFETQIQEVRGEERIKEIADMLSGAERTEAALNNARTLLKQYQE